MAELPEIIILARQMHRELVPAPLEGLELGLEKPLNASPDSFRQELLGRPLEAVRPLGKWLVLEFAGLGPNLMIHPGMGMDLLSLDVQNGGEHHFRFLFQGGKGFTIRFWWFGYIRLAEPDTEPEVGGGLGLVPLSSAFTREALDGLITKKKGTGLKSFLLNQKNLAGIGNFYVHDICFRLGAHPRTRLADLSREQANGLCRAVEETLSSAVLRGINYFEYDFFGHKGDWDQSSFLVGYQEGAPCPKCGRPIVKEKIGSTSSYICPDCQPEIK